MPLNGYVDLCTDNLIAGWVWDSDHPTRRVIVKLLVDGKSLKHLTADQYREDLQTAGIGDGAYGFHYVPPSPIDPDKQRFSAIVADTDFRLLGRSDVCKKISIPAPCNPHESVRM